MKSYLRFLRRNKLYTLIQLIGLSLSLAFVILLSSFIIEELSYNKVLEGTEDIYLCCIKDAETTLSSNKIPEWTKDIPELEECCQFRYDAHFSKEGTGNCVLLDGQRVDAATIFASDNFFKFFTFPIEGHPDIAGIPRGTAMISRSLANKLFHNESPIGKSVDYELRDGYSYQFTVTAVFKDFTNTSFPQTDLITSIDEYTAHDYYPLSSQRNDLVEASNTTTCFRIKDLSSKEELEGKILESCRMGGDILTMMGIHPGIDLMAFDKLNAEKQSQPFVNLINRQLYSTFTLCSIILLVFALLNYVSLTIAFSGFRIKEMATRRLLGTSRKGIILKCTLESVFLMTISYILAIIAAIIIEEPVSEMLGKEIDIFSNVREYIWAGLIIMIMSAAAGLSPALILSTHNPADVVKGEVRRKTKVIGGKLLICIQSALSIACAASAIVIALQTSRLVNEPVGYDTEGVVFVDILNDYTNSFKDKIASLASVKRIGSTNGSPTTDNCLYSKIKVNGEERNIRMYNCDTTAADILGIRTVDKSEIFQEGDDVQWDETMGSIAPELKIGSLKRPYNGFTAIGNHPFFRNRNDMVLEVHGEENEVCKEIASFYLAKGYDDRHVAVSPLRKLLNENYRKEINILKMVSIFALLCIMLSAMATIALSSYHAQMNTLDTAIHKVLGMSSGMVFLRTTSKFLVPVILGALISIPVTFTFLERWLEDYPIRVDNDPLTYVAAFVIVLLISFASISIQALKLMRTNPAEALKKE